MSNTTSVLLIECDNESRPRCAAKAWLGRRGIPRGWQSLGFYILYSCEIKVRPCLILLSVNKVLYMFEINLQRFSDRSVDLWCVPDPNLESGWRQFLKNSRGRYLITAINVLKCLQSSAFEVSYTTKWHHLRISYVSIALSYSGQMSKMSFLKYESWQFQNLT